MSDFDLFETDEVDDFDLDMEREEGEGEDVFEDEGAASASKRRREEDAEEERDEQAREEEYKKVASFQHIGLVGSRKLIEAKNYDKKLSQIAKSLDLPFGDLDYILEKIASRVDIRVEYKNPAALILGYIMLINVLRNENITKIPRFREQIQTQKFLELNPVIKTTSKSIFEKISNKYFGTSAYKEVLSGVDPRDIIRYFELLRKLPLIL